MPGSASTIASSLTTSSAKAAGRLTVHFIDVGQGDSILLVGPHQEVLLIDGGESGSGVLAYLQEQDISRVDLMVATHPHADHIGGLVDILEALPVQEVVTNGEPTTTKTYERFLDGIIAAKARYTEVKRGDRLSAGALDLAVLSPGGDTAEEDLNQGSLVLRLVFGEVAFLFAGDSVYQAENAMLAAGLDVGAQILKVGHHGSSSVSSPAFLAQVKPEVAIYCCGAANSYGHPHPETLANLAEAGADIYGTDVNGTVVVTTDGTTYSLRAERGGARAPPSGTTLAPAVSSAELTLEVASLSSPVSPGALLSSP